MGKAEVTALDDLLYGAGLPPKTRPKRRQPMKGGGLSKRQLSMLTQRLYKSMYGVADIERAIEVTVQKVSEDPSVDANALFKTQVQTCWAWTT